MPNWIAEPVERSDYWYVHHGIKDGYWWEPYWCDGDPDNDFIMWVWMPDGGGPLEWWDLPHLRLVATSPAASWVIDTVYEGALNSFTQWDGWAITPCAGEAVNLAGGDATFYNNVVITYPEV